MTNTPTPGVRDMVERVMEFNGLSTAHPSCRPRTDITEDSAI
jgi:hypothetical protein